MITSAYDDIAEWYDKWLGTHAMAEEPYFPEAEALMGEVTGQRICDLACGQGRVARYLADQGARVVGIDLSAKLLAIARRHEAAARNEPWTGTDATSWMTQRLCWPVSYHLG